MGILKILLYLLLIFFPLGVLPRIHIYKSIYLYPTDLTIFFISFSLIILICKKKNIMLSSPLLKPLLIFIIYAFITLLINMKYLTLEYFTISSLYLLRFSAYASLIFVFRYLEIDFIKKYIFYLSLSGLVFVLLGFVQYFFYYDLRPLYYLGWDEHLYRIFSTFLDPNFAGAVFVLELVLLVSFLDFKFKEKISKYIFLPGIFLTVLAIFLTYSRSTFVMLLTAAVAYLTVNKKKKYIIVFLMLFILGMIIVPKRNLSSEGMNLTRIASIISRKESYVNALNIFKENPVVGVGFGAYRYAQYRYKTYDPENWEITHSGAGTSNSLLLILVTTGIIGFLLFLNFIHSIFKNTIKKKGDQEIRSFWKSIIISSLIGILTHSLFENTLFYPFTMLWIFLIIGLFIARKSMKKMNNF